MQSDGRCVVCPRSRVCCWCTGCIRAGRSRGTAAEAAATPVWHYIGAYFGLGLIVIGAGLGIGKGAAAAAEGISRQPAAAAQITGTVNLPIFLLEGVAILAEVFVLIVVVLK